VWVRLSLFYLFQLNLDARAEMLSCVIQDIVELIVWRRTESTQKPNLYMCQCLVSDKEITQLSSTNNGTYRVFQKTVPLFYFYDNFRKCTPILTIFSLLEPEIYDA